VLLYVSRSAGEGTMSYRPIASRYSAAEASFLAPCTSMLKTGKAAVANLSTVLSLLTVMMVLR